MLGAHYDEGDSVGKALAYVSLAPFAVVLHHLSCLYSRRCVAGSVHAQAYAHARANAQGSGRQAPNSLLGQLWDSCDCLQPACAVAVTWHDDAHVPWLRLRNRVAHGFAP